MQQCTLKQNLSKKFVQQAQDGDQTYEAITETAERCMCTCLEYKLPMVVPVSQSVFD